MLDHLETMYSHECSLGGDANVDDYPAFQIATFWQHPTAF